MEVAGLVVGVAGVAGLFSTCVDCYELVQRGRYLGKDYILLETKFSNQRLRFITWGKACGLVDSDGSGETFQNEDVRSNIRDTLVQLVALLGDGSDLKKKYGLKKWNANGTSSASSGMVTAALGLISPTLKVPSTMTLSRSLEELRDQANWMRNTTSVTKTTRWAIEDKRKFTELVQHLKDFNDDLEDFTKPLDVLLKQLSRTQRNIIRAEVESLSDIPELETMEEARLGQIDAISDAASVRLWTLNNHISEDTVTTTSSGQRMVVEPREDGEWEDVAQDDTLASSNITTAQFQILHRVKCSDATTQIYLDPPIYRESHMDSEHWTVVEQGERICTQTPLHLGGYRRISGLETYMQQNELLQSVLVQDYACNHNYKAGANFEPPPDQHTLYITSPTLCSQLQKLVFGMNLPYVLNFKLNTPMRGPFLWYGRP
ncbi:hypothetical protein K504DRAFT_438261 [Pleomassaria siparia CBS 279.74]|uniref:Prion-inhibition and propagation HeLo domain-containing protein n=1 Tax=Pleomassaria siparia CBS 279.74 TaxID=1314801 RepID=A0A6G1K021_9PLEO|nr:hypothetical protein K504DRAFT_438261 [Pleomassaria siparia CBS 279.74]